MKEILVLVLIFIFVNCVVANCSENQIDINSASASELDKLAGIGSVKAQAIIDTRTFETIDELDKVKGIGEVTLQKIKEQGLACVEDEEQENEPAEKETKKNETKKIEEYNFSQELNNKVEEKNSEISIIELNAALHENNI